MYSSLKYLAQLEAVGQKWNQLYWQKSVVHTKKLILQHSWYVGFIKASQLPWEEIQRQQSWTAKHSLPCISEPGLVIFGNTSLISIKVTCMSWRPLGKTILLEPEIAWQAITRHHFFESYSDFHFWWKSDVSEIGFLPTLSRYFVKSNSRCFWIKSQHRLKDKHRSFLLVTLCNWLAFSSGTRSSSLQWRIWNSDSL